MADADTGHDQAGDVEGDTHTYDSTPAPETEPSGPGAPEERPQAGSATPEVDPRRPQFGWRGWVLVAFTLISFFVIPGVLVALAYDRAVIVAFGLSWQQAYLVLPLVPAIVLGALAVWATTRP